MIFSRTKEGTDVYAEELNLVYVDGRKYLNLGLLAVTNFAIQMFLM